MISVQLNNGKNVSLGTYLEHKSSYLEWVLELNKKATCLAKTRTMEESISTCDGGFVKTKSVP